MAKLKLTNSQLADSVGITQAYMSQIVNGLRLPNINIAQRIAAALKCKIDDLM